MNKINKTGKACKTCRTRGQQMRKYAFGLTRFIMAIVKPRPDTRPTDVAIVGQGQRFFPGSHNILIIYFNDFYKDGTDGPTYARTDTSLLLLLWPGSQSGYLLKHIWIVKMRRRI